MKIPLTKPYWGSKEEKIVVEALRHSSGTGDGPYSKKLVGILSKFTGSRYVLPVTSCTHGLELAMHSLVQTGRLRAGDEVILPSFTMSSTANAVLLAGARPIFADIEGTYFGIDPVDIERKITTRTRGIIVVPYAGMPVDYRRILVIARKHKLFMVEDAAHAVGATWRGRHMGTIGDIGVYSFHGTKNISCGEGGVVLTNHKQLADIMEVYRANGTNRAAFLAGIVDKYSWVSKGTSYFLSDILCSIVISQINQIRYINNKRNQIAYKYTKGLQKYTSLLQLPSVPKETVPNWHIYAIKFYKNHHRNIFLDKMRSKGIDVAYHYVPLHSSAMGERIGGRKSKLPVTDDVWQTLIRLPIYPGLGLKEQHIILSAAHAILSPLLQSK